MSRIQLEPRPPRLRPASNTSFHHPPNEPQLTQNQKKEKTKAESLKVRAKCLAVIYEKIVSSSSYLLHACWLVFTVHQKLTLRSGGVGSLSTIRAFVPFSVIPIAVSLERSSSPNLIFVHHQGSKYTEEVGSRGLSQWSLELVRFRAHGREGLLRQTHRFGCALSTGR